jgi:diacylglycerol O-acyltransferase
METAGHRVSWFGSRDPVNPGSMKRLSSVEAALWFAETHACPTHSGCLMICDASEAPNFCFDAVRDLLADRLPELPLLRYRVAGARLGLDRPWFVEDPRLDIDFHVRRIAAPSSGARREFDELVGRLMSCPLDRARPPWQLWLIEGMEQGRAAVLMKFHHALVDGASGPGLVETMLDISPQPRPPAIDANPSLAESGMPRFARRALWAIFNVVVMTPYRIVGVLEQTLRQQIAVRRLANRPPHFFEAPTTRFNRPISPQRRISGTRLPMTRVKAVKRAFGVTLNDVVLAVVSGALRRYLQDRGELPERPLLAQVPISIRGESPEVGSQLRSMTVGLATDVTDPAERMKTIFGNTQGAKEMAKVLTAHQSIGVTETLPPGLLGLAARVYTASRLGTHVAPINVVISNVPGPDYRFYLAGAVVEQWVPIGTLMLDVGLNITCFTYHGGVDFGLLTTPQIADDIGDLADAIEPALKELEEAAGLDVVSA